MQCVEHTVAQGIVPKNFFFALVKIYFVDLGKSINFAPN